MQLKWRHSKKLKPGNNLDDTIRTTTLEPHPCDSEQIMSAPQTDYTPHPEPLGSPVLTDLTPLTTCTPSSFTPSLSADFVFEYEEIDTTSVAGLVKHIKYSDEMRNLFEAEPQLKTFIHDVLIRNVGERRVYFVNMILKELWLINFKQIMKKEYALDPDENRMRKAARHLICSTTTRIAASHRELLFSVMTNELFTMVQNPTQQQKEAVEQAANNITALAIAFFQKTAVERAIPKIEITLAAFRKVAVEKGFRYGDPCAFTIQANRIQIAVNEELTESPIQPSVSQPVSVQSYSTMEAVFEKAGLVQPPRGSDSSSARDDYRRNYLGDKLGEC